MYRRLEPLWVAYIAAGRALAAAVLVGVLPYAWVLYAVRAGQLPSRHIPDRNQRLRPLGIAAAAALTGLANLHLLRAARQLVALVAALVTGRIATAAITRRWMIAPTPPSPAGTADHPHHRLRARGCHELAVVVATGWSRVQLRDHTAAQVIAGGLLGGLVAAVVFTRLR